MVGQTRDIALPVTLAIAGHPIIMIVYTILMGGWEYAISESARIPVQVQPIDANTATTGQRNGAALALRIIALAVTWLETNTMAMGTEHAPRAKTLPAVVLIRCGTTATVLVRLSGLTAIQTEGSGPRQLVTPWEPR